MEREPRKEALDTSMDEDLEAILKDLPREMNLLNDVRIYNYQGCWIPDFFFRGVVSAHKNFVARDDDIVLASSSQSGSTWLKSLAFSIVYRTHFTFDDSPLLKENPHDLVPYIERGCKSPNSRAPRLLASHIPYKLLPPSIKTSSSKIVYISRNPMDQFISLWHFIARCKGEDAEPKYLEECFDKFCRGIHVYGPFWDHVLGFWEASLERPEKILFLKYEDLKKDPLVIVKRLAEFLGFPFSEEEQKQGLIEEIVEFCSIERMKNLEVNKKGKRQTGFSNSAFFRKGEVGDSKNFLTPTMIERMEKLMQEKYGDHNLAIKFSL